MSRYIPPAVSPGLGTLVGVRPGDYDENIFFNKSITLIVIKITAIEHHPGAMAERQGVEGLAPRVVQAEAMIHVPAGDTYSTADHLMTR
jgi:hypothetical protein